MEIECCLQGTPGCELREWLDPEFTKRSIDIINGLKRTNDALTSQLEEDMKLSKAVELDLMKRLQEVNDLLSDAVKKCIVF